MFLCVYFMLRCLGSTRHNETKTKYNHQMVQCEGYLLPRLYSKNSKRFKYSMSFVCNIINQVNLQGVHLALEIRNAASGN